MDSLQNLAPTRARASTRQAQDRVRPTASPVRLTDFRGNDDVATGVAIAEVDRAPEAPAAPPRLSGAAAAEDDEVTHRLRQTLFQNPAGQTNL